MPHYFGGNIPWLKTQELRDGWVYDTGENISEQGLSNSSAKLLPRDTVMMAMYGGGTVGNLALLGREMACNQASCAMIVDPEKADHRFLYYHLLNDRRRVVGLANGAAQQNLSATTIKALFYAFPPLYEQHRIVAVMSAVDAQITALEAELAALRRVRTDLLNDSLSGSAADGWVETTLGKVAEINPESVPKTWSDLREILYIDIASVSRERGIDIESLSPRPFGSAPGRARRRIREGDVLVSTVRPNLRSFALVPRQLEGEVASTGFAVIRSNQNTAPGLVWCVVNSDAFVAAMVTKCTGSNYPAIRGDDVASYRFALPPLEEQHRIVAQISAVDDQIAAFESELAAQRRARTELLNAILSQKITVDEAVDQFVEEVV